MVRSSFHILLFTCFIITVKGQDDKRKSSADSLKKIISASTSDQEKIDALHHLSEILPAEQRSDVIAFSEQALSIAIRNDDTREIVRCYTNLGKLYSAYGENEKAISYFYKAIYSAPSEKPFVAPTWLELATAHKKMSRPDSTEKALWTALRINESRKDPSLEGMAQNMLGELARERGKGTFECR
jgi:tetratricopeptide (TPR) repeat protein